MNSTIRFLLRVPRHWLQFLLFFLYLNVFVQRTTFPRNAFLYLASPLLATNPFTTLVSVNPISVIPFKASMAKKTLLSFAFQVVPRVFPKVLCSPTTTLLLKWYKSPTLTRTPTLLPMSYSASCPSIISLVSLRLSLEPFIVPILLLSCKSGILSSFASWWKSTRWPTSILYLPLVRHIDWMKDDPMLMYSW